jgi:hypothetical protein
MRVVDLIGACKKKCTHSRSAQNSDRIGFGPYTLPPHMPPHEKRRRDRVGSFSFRCATKTACILNSFRFPKGKLVTDAEWIRLNYSLIKVYMLANRKWCSKAIKFICTVRTINYIKMSSTGGDVNDKAVQHQTVGPKLAPYNPTNMDAVTLALQMLQLSPHDVLYDLGCGDGRLLIEVISHSICDSEWSIKI